MTTFDGNLTFIYSENARTKIKELSAMLKKSPQRLKYSLSVLEKEGLINNPYCIFDYSRFGLILFRVYFKGGYISEEDKTEIIRKLSENRYVTSVYELSGEFDLVIEMLSPNPSRLNKELKKVATLIPTLNYYIVILNVVTHVYPREYLVSKPGLATRTKQEIIIGGDRPVEMFNKKELDVAKTILKEPKIRLTKLAEQTGLNIKTATSVFKNLQKRKTIRGFKYVVDTNKLDIQNFRLFLNFHSVSEERENQLMDFMLKTKEIVEVNKTVGDWDMEVDIESPDKTKVRELIIQIRKEFNDLIETFNITEFYKYYKKSYLPTYLFEESSVR